MRTARLLTAVILMALAATSAAARRPSEPDPSPLYVLDQAAPPQASRLHLPDAAEVFLIRVSPDEVAANPPSFLIELPGHPLLEAVRTNFDVYGPDWKSWFGTLRYASGGAETGFIYLGYHGNWLTADIDFAGERYQIVGAPGEGHRLVRLSDESSPPPCGLEATADPLETGLFRDRRSSTGAPAMVAAPQSANATRIDVLAVYPKDFFRNDTEEYLAFNFIRDSISKANISFENSQIDAYYNLVGIVPIIGSDQPPATGVYDALLWLNGFNRQPPGPPAEVASLRNAFGADLVTLVVPYTYSSNFPCGVGNLPRKNGTFHTIISSTSEGVRNEPMGDRAFTAVRSRCGGGDYTMAHEIGHNFGLFHDDSSDSEALSSVGYGYLFMVGTQQKATIMGCTCGRSPKPACTTGNAVCNRVQHFSNPMVEYPGYPGVKTGDAQHDEASAIRAQLLVNSYTNIPRLRDESLNTPPDAYFTVSCTDHTCTFNAAGTTDNVAIPPNNYWWDFGEPGKVIQQGGSTITYTYDSSHPTGKSFPVHLVVKDSGGQTDVVWKTATIQPVYEGYHDIATCRDIFGWAWDKNMPNTPINVDIYRDGVHTATVSAGLFRQDLLNAGKGNGYHGFNYVPSSSAWRDGRWHTPLVRFGGTLTNLTWSPRNNIVCNACSLCDLPIGETLPTGGQYTVGTQFSSSAGGQINRLGFYRASGETGTNTLRLWTDSGSLLASVTPTCSSSGWCWASISPVTITAGTRYRVGVTVNTSYVKTGCGLGGGYNNGYGPLTAHSGYWIAGNAFPTGGSCSNFFVDVRFDV